VVVKPLLLTLLIQLPELHIIHLREVMRPLLLVLLILLWGFLFALLEKSLLMEASLARAMHLTMETSLATGTVLTMEADHRMVARSSTPSIKELERR
jgi:hypothetical protein